MKKKKLLYLGGNHADIPLIKAAVNMGFYVITVGKNSKGLGHAYGNEYINEDFSDKEKILRIAAKLNVDYICPSCSDFAEITASYVCEKLGLPGHDTEEVSEIIHKKDLFREFCEKRGIKIPKFYNFVDIDQILKLEKQFRYPMIIKPVDLDSGKGIKKVNNFNELLKSSKEAFYLSRSNRIVIEEFIEGTRHATSLIVRNNEIEFIFIDDEQYYLNPYMVAAASSSYKINKYLTRVLKTEINKIIKLLNLVDGLLHVQFIVKKEEVYIIEACRRPPGEFYVKLVEYVTEIPYTEHIIKGYIGETELISVENTKKNYYIRQCIMADENGIIEGVYLDEYLKSKMVEKFYWNDIGSVINNYLSEKIGVIFLKFENIEEMQLCIENMAKYIKVIMKRAEA